MKSKANQIEKQIKALQARLEELKQKQLEPSGLYTLVIKDEKSGKTIHTFVDKTAEELHTLRRDYYKVLALKLKMKISMSKVTQYKSA